jgi:hypothetical protein
MGSILDLLCDASEHGWMDYSREAQEALLLNILRENETTLFGREYLFREITNAEDFRRCVPLSMYSDLRPYVQLEMSGKKHSLVSEPLDAWIETVGISGTVKLFPYTGSVARSFLEAFLRLFSSRAEDWKYFQGKILAALGQSIHVVGEKPAGCALSLGIQTLREIPIFHKVFTPSLNTEITDWEKRWMEIARQVSRQSIVAAMVDPVLFLLFLRKMMTEYKPRNITDIHTLWPDLSLVISSTGLDPYKSVFRSILGSVEFREMFCTDDRIIAIQTDEKGVVPLYDQNFLEFISLREWEDMIEEGGYYRDFEFDVRTAETVRQGEEYVLAITAAGGLYRYVPGDIVRIVDNVHIAQSGFIEQREAGAEQNAEQLVLLREVAKYGLNTENGDGYQVVAVESEPIRYLFGIQ